MRLSLLLPPGHPEVYPEVRGCLYAGCGGRHVQHWQTVPKPLRDTQLRYVVAQRYRCVRCRRTISGLSPGRQPRSNHCAAQGVAVMSYVLEMSYGAVATALCALGWLITLVL